MRLEYKWLATMVGVIGLFMAVLDNTIVNVALPNMQAAFNTDRSTITWVITGYFLSQAAIIPVTGYLSDRFGTKLVFMIALAVFTFGSGLCALAPNEGLLIAARVVQGLGGGALFPVVFAITFRVFTPEQRGAASAVIGVPILLAPAFGPTIGGYLTTTFNWNAIFLINVPLGIIALFLAARILRNRRAEVAAGDEVAPGKGFDIPGLVLSIVGVTALVYGISRSSETYTTGAGATLSQHVRGWTDSQVLFFLITGIVLLIAFVLIELRSKDPVLDVRLFKNYTFSATNVLTWVLSGVLFGFLFLLPVFFEQVQGQSPLSTGEILIPQGLAAAVGVVLAGRFYNLLGPRPLVVIGLILTVVGSYGFTNLTIHSASSTLQIWLVVRGLGFGMSNIPLQTMAVSTISNRAMARASSLINVTRQIFSAIGITLLTSYLIQQGTNHAAEVKTQFTNGPLQDAQTQCATQFAPNVGAIKNCVGQFAQSHAKDYITQHVTTLALNDTFLVVTFGCAACVLIAVFLGRDPNVQKFKAAKARGEKIAAQPAIVGE